MTKPLIETNPYLKNAEMRNKLISRSVRSSCGVEGIKASGYVATKITKRKAKRIYQFLIDLTHQNSL